MDINQTVTDNCITDRNYTIYQDERRLNVSSQFDYAKSFDRWMLVSAGSTLGLSTTFISQVVPLATAKWTSWLALGWLCLIISVIAILISMHCSHYAFGASVNAMDDIAEERGFATEDFWRHVRERQSKCLYAKAVNVLNWTAIGSFVPGLGLVIAFVAKNL